MFNNTKRSNFSIPSPTIPSQDVVTGDTLCDEKAPILLERMEFPDPVIKVGCRVVVVAVCCCALVVALWWCPRVCGVRDAPGGALVPLGGVVLVGMA